MNEIPLSDASFSEVLARVAFRIIERQWTKYGHLYEDRNHFWLHLARRLDRAGFSALSFWVAAYAYHDERNLTFDFAKTAFIMRARLNMPFRLVAYFDYKGTRRRDPRVTNRGVTTKGTREAGQ